MILTLAYSNNMHLSAVLATASASIALPVHLLKTYHNIGQGPTGVRDPIIGNYNNIDVLSDI